MKILLKLKKYLFLICYIIIAVFLCYQALLSEEKSHDTSNKFQEIISQTPPYQYLDSKIPDFDAVTRKLFGHFLLYSLLGIFSYLTYFSFIRNPKIAQFINLSTGFLLASLTELLQMFAEGRNAVFQDIVINYEGFLLSNGLILTIIVLFLINSKDKLKTVNFNILIEFLSVFIFEVFFILFAQKINSLMFCNYFFAIFSIVWIILITIKYLVIRKK